MLVVFSVIGYDDHTDVFCIPNNSQDRISAEHMRPGSVGGSVQQYLRNLISPREVQNQICGVSSFKDPGFNMEIPRQVQMCFDRIRFFGAILPLSRRYTNGETICFQVIRHPSATPDQHRG